MYKNLQGGKIIFSWVRDDKINKTRLSKNSTYFIKFDINILAFGKI